MMSPGYVLSQVWHLIELIPDLCVIFVNLSLNYLIHLLNTLDKGQCRLKRIVNK